MRRIELEICRAVPSEAFEIGFRPLRLPARLDAGGQLSQPDCKRPGGNRYGPAGYGAVGHQLRRGLQFLFIGLSRDQRQRHE